LHLFRDGGLLEFQQLKELGDKKDKMDTVSELDRLTQLRALIEDFVNVATKIG
jgi:hypothetical protein